ncbi:uncharacterized protein LOC8080630 [Sorghum bicolor]|uniref:DUF7815 domain-containing protein n=1 Tax=Sorghum bicolor TaxID=4558 RepID=C5YLQ8_SORBI|nr:uncharacterized protein LOC8080630 [Sorghum bicolor]EES15084.1 hypothetical protein SORBI_3007G145400 [Sorghum bicolor]|eukprot:XP_002445589.1 uncharacterized protein LOC8080630 [Sorghum bicolor]
MEIPTAVIHRLQSSLREATFAPPVEDAPAPPFPSVADAVAAFDSGAASVSAELRCARCGAAGGLLRGARSALCAYCGCPRRGEETEGGGSGGIAFRDGAAYRWLLGSLGLDGSEFVEFDTDTTATNKSKDAPPPNSGMIISDLLDLKITCLPENKETSASSITKEQSSSVDTLNLSAANLDSFYVERKEEMTSASLPQTHNVEQEKKRTDSKNHESRLEVHAASKSLISSRRTNKIEATPAFASWDADFQSANSESAAKNSKQPDLFKSSSEAESFSFPASETAIKPVVGTENKTNTSAILEHHSEDLASASGTLFGDDDLSNQKVAQPIFESNSAPESTESSLRMNFAKRDQLHEMDDTGVNDDEAFDEWQEFTASGNQGSLSNAGEHMEEPLKRNSSEKDVIDPWPVGNKESPSNGIEDSSEWQAFASVSGQGRDFVTSVERSTSGHGLKLVRPVGVEETMINISHQHSSEINPVDLWPVGNVEAQNAAEMVKETNNDNWQDFTATGQVQDTSLNQTGDMMEVPKASHKETDMDSWFIGNFGEPANTGTVNENNMLDDWQGFTGSDQAQPNSSSTGAEMTSVPFEQHDGSVSVQSWANASSNDAAKTSSTNIESDTFDVWQDFAKFGHLQEKMSSLGGEPSSVSPEPAKENDSLDLWLTSNFKESKSIDVVGRTNASSDGWQDFASFDQAQRSNEIPVEGHHVKDPSGAETMDLWASSHANEKNLEQISGNNDLFDDWQDFQNSRPQQTTLQVSSDASLFDTTSASSPDAFGGLEFGSVLQLASSENLKDKKEASNESKAFPSDDHLKSTNGMQQMGDVDSLSSLWPTNKPEPANTNVEQLLAQMHDLSFMLKDELSVPDKPIDHSKP